MDIVLRSIVVFLFIWVLMRIVGRRELSTMEPFDLIIIIVIGDLVQQAATQQDMSVTGAILSAGTIGLLTVLFSWFSWRFPRVRPVLDGKPIVIVEDGKPLMDNMRGGGWTMEGFAAQGGWRGFEWLDS